MPDTSRRDVLTGAVAAAACPLPASGSGHPTDEALLATLAAAVEDIWRHYDCRGNARPSPTCSWNSFHAARTTSLVTNGSKTIQPVLPRTKEISSPPDWSHGARPDKQPLGRC